MSNYIPNNTIPANTTNTSLDEYNRPLGYHGINANVPGGYGSSFANPIIGSTIHVTAKRTAKDKWKHALNQGKTMLKDAWKNMKKKQVIRPEDKRTTDLTNFKMGIVNKALSGPENKANQQNFSINRSTLNPRNGLLGQGYGGAGSYKV